MIIKLGVILTLAILNVVEAQTSDYCSITKKHTMCQTQVTNLQIWLLHIV